MSHNALHRSALMKAAWADQDDDGYGMMPQTLPGPTLGSLEDAIMHDASIGVMQRNTALQLLRQRTAGMPDSMPLSRVILGLGGGLLGYLVAKYFSMGGMGQVLATAAGYGIGRMVGQSARRDPWSNVN